MKKLGLKRIASMFFILGTVAASGQGIQSEVPGDNFSLEGALELFKKSESPQEFEKLLNSENSKVNNLDLNGDGYTDYIRVIDRNEGNVHAFILQAMVSERESQDVAVIELEKLANGKAVLQITGDEDIYGVETIIEPTREVRVYGGTNTSRTVVNVWAWPSVQYIYSPYYSSLWISPWRWSLHPVWYSPWRPVSYAVYHPYWSGYYSYYTPYHTHRVVYARNMYRPYRTTSVVYYNRHQPQITNYRSNHRENNYSRNGYDRNDGRNRNDYNRSNDRNDNNTYNPNRSGNRSGRQSTNFSDETTRTSAPVTRDRDRSQYQPRDNNAGNSTSRRYTPSDNTDNRRSSSDFQRTPRTTERTVTRTPTTTERTVTREQPAESRTRSSNSSNSTGFSRERTPQPSSSPRMQTTRTPQAERGSSTGTSNPQRQRTPSRGR